MPQEDVALGAPWMPVDPALRTTEQLIRSREIFLQSESKRFEQLHEWVVERNRELGFPE